MERDTDLLPRDMPSPNHPLMQNNAEVRTLGDLIDVRENPSQATPELDAENDDDLDVSDALTFPHKKHRRGDAADTETTDFDADARTSSAPDDEDDASYLTRADVEDAMNLTDPDPNVGNDGDDFIGDSGLDRAPDMTGTVTGIGRGLGTHLPQDLGADGFQIEEPETLEGVARDPRVDDAEEEAEDDNELMDTDETALGEEPDGGHIPTPRPDVNTSDEALDATRRLK